MRDYKEKDALGLQKKQISVIRKVPKDGSTTQPGDHLGERWTKRELREGDGETRSRTNKIGKRVRPAKNILAQED